MQLLTSSEFKGRMMVILAGYKQEMEELMEVNTGLRSRFTHTLEFKPMTPDAAAKLLKQIATTSGLQLSADADAQLPIMTAKVCRLICQHLQSLPCFILYQVRNTCAASQQQHEHKHTCKLVFGHSPPSTACVMHATARRLQAKHNPIGDPTVAC